MNQPLGQVEQLHRTTFHLVIDGKEFEFAPHEYHTATQVLMYVTMRRPEAKVSLTMKSHKDTIEIGNDEDVRKMMQQRGGMAVF